MFPKAIVERSLLTKGIKNISMATSAEKSVKDKYHYVQWIKSLTRDVIEISENKDSCVFKVRVFD